MQHKFCAYPFKYVNATKGFMFPCCESWLNPTFYDIKKLDNNDNPTHTWFNTLEPLRQSIIDGSYKYCSSNCPILKTQAMLINKTEFSQEIQNYIDGTRPFTSYPEEIGFSFDSTCNLKCKTCRKNIIIEKDDDIIQLGNKYNDILKHANQIRISGDGDPFASKYYFNLLKTDLTILCNNLNRITLQTNATLFNETNYNKIHPNNKKLIDTILISIDACTEDTYKIVRGGNFNSLCDNLLFITKLKEKNNFFMASTYTISKHNYLEILDFIDFAYKYKFDDIRFDIMQDWGRGYSPEQIGISKNDPSLISILNAVEKKISEYKGKMDIKISFNYKNEDTEILNNNLSNVKYAIFCPFYITNKNKGKWIENWIYNVGIYEKVQKFYTLSFDDDVDIELYSSIIKKLNETCTCISIEKNLQHSDALKKAHEYLKSNMYSYMIHIEQDVILNKSICNTLIDNMITANNDIAITDIKSANYFDTPSDIDISIFAINLTKYDSCFYSLYINTIDTYTSDNTEISMFLEKWNNKPTLIATVSDDEINKNIIFLLNKIYETEMPIYWLNTKLVGTWKIIKTLNPTFIDTARAYVIHAFINHKLTIIKNISESAKHIKQSRNESTNTNITIDQSIEYFGFSPYKNGNPKKHIENPYYSYGIDVVIISNNQNESIQQMIKRLKFDIPCCSRIFVLDRCTDNTNVFLTHMNEQYIERTTAVGFCAGSARNLGLSYTNIENDVLFLDGDRIPTNLNYERMVQMLYYFDISLIKTENDIRKWFTPQPTFNPNFGKFNNEVWSSALLIRRTAINKIFELTNTLNLFNESFDGHWGCEDEYLGDIASKLKLQCGGFPSSIYVDGMCTTIIKNIKEYTHQVEIRKNLRTSSLKPTIKRHRILAEKDQTKDEKREKIKFLIKKLKNYFFIKNNIYLHIQKELKMICLCLHLSSLLSWLLSYDLILVV